MVLPISSATPNSVTTLSTVVFNANPLLRYDGYYMLSDWLGIPNLRTKADRLLQRACSRWCLGIEPLPDPLLPAGGHAWLGLYAVGAQLYGWIVTGGILWFLYSWLKPYGLQSLGQALAVGSLLGIGWQGATTGLRLVKKLLIVRATYLSCASFSSDEAA